MLRLIGDLKKYIKNVFNNNERLIYKTNLI